MAEDKDSERGTPSNYPGKPRNGTNAVDPQETSYMLILCAIAILLDPLFFYTPVINDEKKFLKLDKKLAIAAIVLRTIFDCFYIFFLICRFRRFWIKKEDEKKDKKEDESPKITTKRLCRFFLIDLLSILPLPQVPTFIILSTIRGSKSRNAMSLLKFFVMFQYVPRFMRIHPLFTEATRISSKLVEATWAKAAFNLLLYMLIAHVFGALWYFLAIEREILCWMNACKKHSGCDRNSFYFDDSFEDHTFINDFCTTTTFDFGLFHDALQSGIVAVTNFPKKFVYCFFWGLQNLSSMGQNLQTSSYIWEGLFAILVTISGLVFFVFLIGNMLMYLQYRTTRSEKIKQKLQEIEDWDSYQKLPNLLQKKVTKHQRHILRETNGVDVERFLKDLPRNLRREIKRELCKQPLLKVVEFKEFNGPVEDELLDRLKPAFFAENTSIVQEGDLIDEMLFVIKGELCIYTRNSSSNNDNNRVVEGHLKRGDFCGEKLVTWAKNNACAKNDARNLRISTTSIEALTDVEAFTLTDGDLKKVFELKDSMNKAARRIQSAWLSHKERTPFTGSTGGNDSGSQIAINRFQAAPENTSIPALASSSYQDHCGGTI